MYIAFLAILYCILNILQYSVNINFIYICVTHFLERFTLLQWSVTEPAVSLRSAGVSVCLLQKAELLESQD